MMADIKGKDDFHANDNRLNTAYFNDSKLSCIHYITAAKAFQQVNFVIKKIYERRYIMHYQANKSIAPDGWTVIGYIPTFLFLKQENIDSNTLLRFLAILELEVESGNSFDMAFIEECRLYLNEWTSSLFGAPKEEIALFTISMENLVKLENKNILNIHKNHSTLILNCCPKWYLESVVAGK